MLIAHAPTGLLMAAVLIKLKPETVSWQRWYLMGAVMGLLPDLDMLWFYFVDHKQFHHHVYVPHWPIVWLGGFGVLVSMLSQQACRLRSVVGFGRHVAHGFGQCGGRHRLA